jgi:hypothetical protein
MTTNPAWGQQCWDTVPASCNYVEKYGMTLSQGVLGHAAVHPSSPGPNTQLRPLNCTSSDSSTIHKPLLPLQIFK